MSTIFISHSSQDNAIAKELERRLAEQNHPSVFLDLDPEKGIVAGQSWERTLYRKLRACRAVIVLCTNHYLTSHWCFAEIALARMEGKHIIALQVDPLSPDAKLPAILTEKQFIDLRTNSEDGYQRLWGGLEEMDLLGVANEWDPKQSPYLGLRAYQEQHAPVFFGRDDEARVGLELLDRGAPGLVMVLGASGSGKSSLVRAGMVPRLRRDADRWLVVGPFRPRRDPFAELAEALVQAYQSYAPDEARSAETRERLRALRGAGSGPSSGLGAESAAGDERLPLLLKQLEELRRSPPQAGGAPLLEFLDWSLDDLRRICGEKSLTQPPETPPTDTLPLVEIADHLRRASGHHEARVLLVIDQFEELLGHEDAGDDANRFLELVRHSVETEHSPLMALGTMRSDFLGLFQRNRALLGIDFESLSVGPISVDGMRRVIEEPARLGAIVLEQGLADSLLADTETSDALPLLSFTLLVLWRSRQNGTLSVRQYKELGGLHGAVSREAQAVLDSARWQGQEDDVRRAFLQMARLTEDGSYARLPVSWDREEIHKVQSILEDFEKRRLLVTRMEKDEERTVEVAHEALFRSWKPLKTWLDDHRGTLLLREQLRRDADDWEKKNRAKDNLWRGGRLQQAAELIERDEPGASREVTTVEGAFVHAGLRRRKVQRWTGLCVAALFFLGLGAGLIFALLAKNEAQRQTSIANSGRLASASLLSRMDRLDLASLLAIEAFHVLDTFDARNALLLALQSNPGLETFLHHEAVVNSVAFGPDGTLAAGGEDGTVRLWKVEASGATPLGEPLKSHEDWVSSVTFGPDGTLASASGATKGTVRLWKVGASGATPLGEPLKGHEGGVFSVAFGSDGTLAAGGDDGTVRLWKVEASGATPLGEPLEGHQDPVLSVAFGPDGTLAAGGADGTVRLWKVGASGATPLGEPLKSHEGVVSSVAFGSDGTLAAGGYDGTVRLWKVGASGATPLGEPLKGHEGGVSSVAFGSDGTLAAGGYDGKVRLWKVEASGATPLGEPLEGHKKNTGVNVAFGPDGTLAAGGYDEKVRLWKVEASGATPLGEPLEGQEGGVLSVAFGPDGTLAAGGKDGTVRLWKVGASGATPLGEPLKGHEGGVSSVAFGSDGTLAAGGYDGKVRLWKVEASGATPLGEPLEGQEGGVLSVAFGPDGTLAAGGKDGTVRLWKVGASGATPLGEPLKSHEDWVSSVAFGPDGTLAAGGADGTVRLWKVGASGATPLGEPLKSHEGVVLSVAFGPDGTLASAAGGDDGWVRLWKVGASGATPLGEPLEGLEGVVLSVAFGPDGTLASAAGGYDGTVRLWKVGASGATPLGEPLKDPKGRVSSVAFGPDGTLAAGGWDGTVWLWHLDVKSWLAAACRRANRNFSLAEWRKYMSDETYRSTCPDLLPGEGTADKGSSRQGPSAQ